MRLWLIALLIALNTVTALGVVDNQYRKRVAVIELGRLQDRRDQALDKRSQLSVEYAAWSASERIERIAVERLNMKHVYRNFRYLRL